MKDTLSVTVNEKKGKSAVWWMVGIILCLVVLGFFLLTYEQGVPVEPAGVNQMQEMAQQVQGMEAEVQQKSGEIKTLVEAYRQKSGTDAPETLKNLENLGPKEKELLAQAIGNEEEVSTRALLQKILQKGEEIASLKARIADIESLLPTPHIAKKGESHYQVALDFLMLQKGLNKAQAQDILARTALFEELAEGFKVWNFYNGSEYGTSVTQGEALVSPNAFVHRARKKLLADFGEAVTQRNQLSDHYEAVVSERDQLAQNVRSMEEKQKELTQENMHLASRVSDMDRQLNSLFYRLDSQQNLEKKGILKSGFLRATRLNDIAPSDYDRSLDLNIEDELVISADAVGMGKIHHVALFPKTYKKGSSYKVLITPDQKHALLTLIDKNKFKSERIVIAVR